MHHREHHQPVEITFQPRGMLADSYKFNEELYQCQACHDSKRTTHRQRHLLSVLCKTFTQANTHLMHSSAEIEIYELCLTRQYPQLWDVLTHAGFAKQVYLFAKWFSRYHNIVMPIMNGCLYDAREAMKMRMHDEVGRLEGLEGFVSDLAELTILVEKARMIDEMVHIKAMKEYLMRQLRYVIKTGATICVERANPWRGIHTTIHLDVFDTLERVWKRLYDVTKPIGSQFILFDIEPLPGAMLQVPWPR